MRRHPSSRSLPNLETSERLLVSNVRSIRINADHCKSLRSDFMRRQHYGAVARGSNEEEPLLVPGPEEVKIFPEQWRKAPGWIFVFVVRSFSMISR